MSVFGLLVVLTFMLATGGLVALMYGGNTDLALSKILMFILQLLIGMEFILALYEYPCYVVDGIIFICMGEPKLAWIMLGIFGLIILFVLAMILPRINWRKSLTVSPAKLIFCGLLLVTLLAYTELLNGVYSFESYEQFTATRELYEEYDNRFLPTKYILHADDEHGYEVALYPFDVTTAAGEQPLIYKGETFQKTYDDGTTELFFYPFTYRLYEGAEPVSFESPLHTSVPSVSASDAPGSDVSGSDVSGSDVSGSDVSGSDVSGTDVSGADVSSDAAQ